VEDFIAYQALNFLLPFCFKTKRKSPSGLRVKETLANALNINCQLNRPFSENKEPDEGEQARTKPLVYTTNSIENNKLSLPKNKTNSSNAAPTLIRF